MIGLDTNVLVRYLVEDDAKQSVTAAALVNRVIADGDTLFVSDVVLCETVWVLSGSYRVGRPEIAGVLRSLVRARHLSFRAADQVIRALDAYKVLQVDPEAEDEVIKAAYRRLARKYHPDLVQDAESAARMAAINAAWELIGRTAARAAYDRERASRPGSGGGEAFGAAVRGPGTVRPVAASRPPGPPPESASRDWTSGRSTVGGGFDASMRAPDGLGAAGPPPGRPSGSVLNFGRYNGWSLGEVARRDLEYIEWLDRTPIGRTYREEIDSLLRAAGRRRSAHTEATERRGLFRRR